MNYELSNGSIIEDEQQSSIMEKLMELKPHSSIDYSWDDIGMATLMSDIYASELRYCPQNGKWYSWDGCWRKQGDNGLVSDKLQTMLNLLRLYQREISADKSLSEEEQEIITNYEKYLRTTRKFTSMKNILETLKTVMPIRLSLQDMDSNPYLLNTERGAYDLKTGERVADVRPFNVTKKSATPLPDFTTVECQRWAQFIDEIMGGDKEKAAFLQRALGYSILGVNREECMFIAYGSKTRNGKGTLFSTIATVLGSDYADSASPDLICEGRNGKSTDFNAAQPALAKLVGTRLVTMSESAKGVRLDAASMKTITGRDALVTRDLYESSFTFVPQFTLWLNTNHLPDVTDDTVFASDRIWVIEFNEHFDASKQDKDLKEIFARPENRPTIMKWLYDGCRDYVAHGLMVPQVVKDATANYRKLYDRVNSFIEECCDLGENEKVMRGTIYAAYRAWCCKAENKYNPMGSTSFYKELNWRGYSPKRQSDGWYITGLKLKDGNDAEGRIKLS